MKVFRAFFTGAGLVALLFSTTFGQQMPACAVSKHFLTHLTCTSFSLAQGLCLESSLKAQETCAPTNTTCICTNQPLLGAIQGCVLSTCTLIEALAAQNITQTMCGAPIRDITHITPIVTGVSGGAAIISVITRILVAGGMFALDDVFAIAALV